ncbi:MAG: hypothetical protein QOF90_3106 [Acetobacteraceae bacterium]|jgi:hypothetical protein|nr:hypothetical protein [Acetobacteraceae bacterium]
MPISRRDTRGGRAFAVPLFGVLLLLISYLLLAHWQNVPATMSSILAAAHWPILTN